MSLVFLTNRSGKGTASTRGQQIAEELGAKIDGEDSIDIVALGGALTLYCDGTNWFSV